MAVSLASVRLGRCSDFTLPGRRKYSVESARRYECHSTVRLCCQNISAAPSINGPRHHHGRPDLPCGCKGAQLHPGGRHVGIDPFGGQPYGHRSGKAPGGAAAHPDHPQCHPTEAGERLLRSIGPRFDQIESELAAVSALADSPSGTVRITAIDFVADTILWPKAFAAAAAVSGTASGDQYQLQDDRHCCGAIRLRRPHRRSGGQGHGRRPHFARLPARNRRGARISQKARHSKSILDDLARHNCITMRLATRGALFPWELTNGKQEIQFRAAGQLTYNNTYQILNAALAGGGLAFTPKPLACPTWPPAACRRCLKIGAPPRPASTCITRAAANSPGRKHWWSMRCATGADNGPRQHQRPACLYRCGTGTEFHAGLRQTWRLPVGTQSHNPQPRSTDGRALADPHHPKRVAYRSWRTPVADCRAAV